MALFTDTPTLERLRRRDRAVRAGWVLLFAALIGTFVFAQAPTPYVIERPGPVFNTLGTVKVSGTTQPLLDVPTKKTYPTSGALDMLTVNVYGDRKNPPSWFEVAQAWLDPSQAVVPVDEIYPDNETIEQSNKEAAVEMEGSQQDAQAAALSVLGYPVTATVTVADLPKGSPAAGILAAGDTITQVDGAAVTSLATLRRGIAKAGAGTPVTLGISRGGAAKTVQVTPISSGGDASTPVIGIDAALAYRLPFSVKIRLQDVGGPSAGQMFALGIIDKLTPGSLTGGAKVAGTGTIDGEGNVGAIGGIRQKMYGARGAGATYFLAPKSNCNEVTGHIPSGLKVFAVRTLKDSLAVLDAVSQGRSTRALPTCSAG